MTTTVQPAIEPIIRDATEHDAPELLEVIEAAYPSWPAFPLETPTIDHLRWKMSPPGDIPLHHAAIEVGDRIAATQLRWVCQVQVGDEVHIGETGADLAVHPDFQGMGLARLIKDRDHDRLAENQITGFGMMSNAPQVQHMNEGSVSREMTTWTLPFALRSYLSVHHAAGGPVQAARALWHRARRAPAPLPTPGRITVLERFDERADALWEAARHAYDVIPFRNSQYLNWRFARPFSGEPVILGLLDRGRVLAYAVVRRAGDRGDLMDWLWRPEATAMVPALLDAAIEHLRASGARNITSWLPRGHRAERALRYAGFAPVGTQHILFGTRDRGEAAAGVLDVYEDPRSRLHLTMSDFDHA
ncbi:MAG: hypothetical protein O3A10_06800 [Chloroflexi bacterium]|nr:hypothetical protein [Chloroflexota bacterium]MDA1147037.1 hypothetical protein [Chloroflexota bacterium]